LFARFLPLATALKLSLHSLLVYYVELIWPRIFPDSRYIASAPTAQKTSLAAASVAWRLTAAETCLPLRCVATSEAGRGSATLSTVECVAQQRAINTRTSIVECVFRGFCASTASRMEQTRHNMNRQAILRQKKKIVHSIGIKFAFIYKRIKFVHCFSDKNILPLFARHIYIYIYIYALFDLFHFLNCFAH
jgi:hypothetical protein